MPTDTPVKTEISIDNELNEELVIYDSFSEEAQNEEDQKSDYFGQLTKLRVVAPNGRGTIEPKHKFINTLIAMDSSGTPVARFVSMMGDNSFKATQEDVDTMNTAKKFVDDLTVNPGSDLAKRFTALKNNGDSKYVEEVDDFFAKTDEYKSITFPSYMMALTTKARNPEKLPDLPVEKQPYSMAMLCTYLGGDWPSEFPDILVTKFKCGDKDGTLFVKGTLTLEDLPFENSTVGQEFLSMMPINTVEAEFALCTKMGLNVGGVRMRFIMPNFHFNTGGAGTFTIAKPTVELDINPVFKFVVFKASASLPFKVFNKPFSANLDMVIDNLELVVGATLTTDSEGLQAPPPIRGLFFDEFGVNMGVIFEPPSVVLGLEGKFHIGEGDNVVQLDDDTFALLFTFIEAGEVVVPDPLYLAFNIPELDFSKAVELFTDKKSPVDLPVKLKDLSMRWAENPLEPLALPDGSLTKMGYGFSGYLELLSFKFFGDVEIGGDGLHGTIECTPLHVGKIFSLTGDGKGVKRKVDAKGDIIKNNQVPTTKAMKTAIENAKEKTIVPTGGPELTVSTSSSPFFTLGYSVKVLEQTLEKEQVSVDEHGISFELDYGAILSSKMKCVLKDYHNFSGSFSYGIDKSISLPSFHGFHLGSIPLKATFGAMMKIVTSTSDIKATVEGDFDFEGIKPKIGPLTLDINIESITKVIEHIEKEIENEAATIFKDFFNLAKEWAKNVKKALIAGIYGAEQVAKGLKQAFKQTEKEVAATMKDVGYNMEDVAKGLAGAFVGSGKLVASALVTVFDPTPKHLKAVLKSAGYTAKEIGTIFKSLGGAFEDLGKEILKGLGNLDPRKW